MFEIKEIKNRTEYNPLSIAENAPVTEAWFFGEWQEMMGRKVRRFEIRNNRGIIGFFQIIKYPLVFSKSFLYIPHGPVLIYGAQHTTQINEFLEEFGKTLAEIGKEESAVFIRFDIYSHNPNYGSKESLLKYFKKISSYAYYSSYFQPKFEWILNLNKSEEEILSKMHSKTRYNINLARKKGVKVEIINENLNKYFNDFYKLLKKTARRDNFNLHPKIYYENIFFALGKPASSGKTSAFLVMARYNNKILLANLILMHGETAYFLHGGSGGEFKNFMAPHLAHWEAIKEAKARGMAIYNFGGVDDGDSYKTYHGISVFKKRFGGSLLEYSDSYDLILKPFWYFLYNLRKKFL